MENQCILSTQQYGMYEKCIMYHLSKTMSLTTHRLQFGFKRKSGCCDALYVVSELYQYSRQYKRPLGACLGDINKAFDTIHRGYVWSKLIKRSSTYHNIQVLQSLLNNCSAQLKIGHIISREIKLEIGLLQGTVLSPILC
jgi:hypothetical protein